MNVWWVSLHPEIISRGYADQAILESLLDGTVWRLRLPEFVHREGLPSGPEGGIVVIPARWHVEDVDRIKTALDSMEWALVVLTGDEESVFPWKELQGPRRRIWVQTPRPDVHAEADGLLGDGWWPRTREWLRENESFRRWAWFYSGQINNERREEAFATFRERRDTRRDGVTRATSGFAAGMARTDYLDALASSKVAPAPSGCYSPDTFRVFEALEAGCVPIVDTGTARAAEDYWQFVFHVKPPFPIVRMWSDFGAWVDRIVADWPGWANRCGAWWIAEKRYLAHRFRDHLRELSGWEPAPEQITVLMPVSPIPSHPNSAVLDETIRSVRDRLPGAEIILMFDGVRPEQEGRAADYAEHIRCVIRRCQHGDLPGVLPLIFGAHTHQAGMTRAALREVRTPLILFVEQDTPLVGSIPFDGLAAAVRSGAANVIRLHHEVTVLEPHRHLMLDETPRDVAGVPLLRTVQWSQRPHLADAEFYAGMLDRYFGADARSFIEDVIHGVVHNLWTTRKHGGWDEFRLFMYAPEGPMNRSTHLDGRAGDPKYPQTWAYPTGPVPPGAPNPRIAEARLPKHGRRPNVKWGLLGRADRRGLAIQTTEIARHLDPDRVLGLDMGDLSPYRPDWKDYSPETLTITKLADLTPVLARRWLEGLDVVVTAETFYRAWWTELCAEVGVATVLAPNPEFFAHVSAADWSPMPDVLAAATRWKIGNMPGAIHLPHGVDRDRLPYRERREARTFLHVVGHAARYDRAGTRIIWEALKRVRNPIRLIVRSQTGASIPQRFPAATVEVIDGDLPNYWDLYRDGDVMLMPRRYGGLCLPMQEALSVGMPVLMPDVSPQNGVLPAGMLLDAVTERTVQSNIGALPVHDTNAAGLAARIDALYENPEEVRLLSKQADEIAAGLDWENVSRLWCDVIERAAARRP